MTFGDFDNITVTVKCKVCRGDCTRDKFSSNPATWVHTDEAYVIKDGGVRMEGTTDHVAVPDIIDVECHAAGDPPPPPRTSPLGPWSVIRRPLDRP